jgi:dipeptidyl aminopeptidase/acylaminoacyl peptidase
MATTCLALGASYGGFMINWIAGNWNQPFKCAGQRTTASSTRFAMGYSAPRSSGSPTGRTAAASFTKPGNYETFNPLLHADQLARTRCWSSTATRTSACRSPRASAASPPASAKGIESKYLRFPDENHWVLKPQNSMQWHTEVFGWLEKYIGGGR